jgi:hypothetical protein
MARAAAAATGSSYRARICGHTIVRIIFTPSSPRVGFPHLSDAGTSAIALNPGFISTPHFAFPEIRAHRALICGLVRARYASA